MSAGTGRETNEPSPMRREKIWQLVREQGIVKISDLTTQFGVTPMTIRRDFDVLAREGLIERVHGGAMMRDRGPKEPLYRQKALLRKTQKDAIARTAAKLVQDGDTLFVNSGSTTLRLFREITAKNVKIVTVNAFFPTEDVADGVEVICTGGIFRRESFTFVGSGAINVIRSVNAGKAFLGVDGIDVTHGITTPVWEEALINRAMVENTAGPVVVLADSTKIGKVSSFCASSITQIDSLITDSDITAAQKKSLEKAGVEVVVCR